MMDTSKMVVGQRITMAGSADRLPSDGEVVKVTPDGIEVRIRRYGRFNDYVIYKFTREGECIDMDGEPSGYFVDEVDEHGKRVLGSTE
jgi:hypothetical protein